MKLWTFVLAFFVLSDAAWAGEPPDLELVLPDGTFYSVAHRTYRSLRLPEGWTVVAGAVSPDHAALALLLAGATVPPAKKQPTSPAVQGPINTLVRGWSASTRLLVLNRQTGAVSRAWRVSASSAPLESTVAWPDATQVTVRRRDLFCRFDTARNTVSKPEPDARAPATAGDGTCPKTLASARFHDKNLRFTVETSNCSSPPETSDIYRLMGENDPTHKEDILWERRVPADKTLCAQPYACYTGDAVRFFAVGGRLALMWDADLFTVAETDDGADVRLITQLLPQYDHPWSIAPGETHLDARDWTNPVAYQPVSATLWIPHAENPILYLRNFSSTRSYNAAVDVGVYPLSRTVPAGYQVGPVDVGSFKDQAYTPLLVTATWTAIHQVMDPIFCKQPYTVSPATKGIVVSLTENSFGALQCSIDFQDDR